MRPALWDRRFAPVARALPCALEAQGRDFLAQRIALVFKRCPALAWRPDLLVILLGSLAMRGARRLKEVTVPSVLSACAIPRSSTVLIACPTLWYLYS